MTGRYHYRILETERFGLTVYLWGVFRGDRLIYRSERMDRRLAESDAARLANKLNKAGAA